MEVSLHSSEPTWDIKGSSRTTTVGGVTARLSKASQLGNGNGLSTPVVQLVWKHQEKWMKVVGGLSEADTKRLAEGLIPKPAEPVVP